MENIGWFSDFVTAYGVQKEYGFVTVDLYEKQNISQVSNNLSCLSAFNPCMTISPVKESGKYKLV